MSIGKITQIIGAVIDVEFPSDSIPKVYNALHVTKATLHWRFSNSLVIMSLELSLWVDLKDFSEV